MDKAAILELLKEHLTITIDLEKQRGSYGSGDYVEATVTVKFDGEVISTDYDTISVPTED